MRTVVRSLSIAAVFFLGTAFVPTLARAQDLAQVEDLRAQARQYEKDKKWAKASSYYAFLLSRNRNPDDKDHFQNCLRNLHRVRRHQDPSYRKQVLEQEVPVALKVYGEVLNQLRAEYVDSESADLNRLFRQGIQELRMALNDAEFCKRYLPAAGKADVENFVLKMQDNWGNKNLSSIDDLQQAALRLAMGAKKSLGLKPTVTVLEFACGACNALDEHTYYLTPQQFGDDVSSIRGEVVGVGIELGMTGRKLVIAQVVMNGPAARAGLRGDEQILRIGRFQARDLSLEEAVDKLKGKLGTTVELEILVADKPRILTLVRQQVNGSVTFYRMLEANVGYVSLVAFQENTLQELDLAIRNLELQGMKTLILDLRGNSGGLFDSAVQVAERFLWEGAYIVSTRGKVRDVKRISRNTNPLGVPLVVLVDGGTASAAEIVAGALKENVSADDMQPRAQLIGMPTFGKGTVQHLAELKTVQAGGIRITWAKFFSPQNHPYNGIGIEPHYRVEGPDAQLTKALHISRLLVDRQMTMMR